MKCSTISIIGILLLWSDRSGDAQSFGKEPFQDVELAAREYNYAAQNPDECPALDTDRLIAYMLAPTWWEDLNSDADFQPPRSPSPMTLGRFDNGDFLYPGRDPVRYTHFRRAFWHTGVGLWQLDDSGHGTRMSFGKFESWESAVKVATVMSQRFCESAGNPNAIFAGWVACFKGDGRRCERTFNRLYYQGGLSELRAEKLDGSVTRFGGSQLRTCSIPGIPEFPCLFVDTAHPEGDVQSWRVNPDGNPPLAKPFYVYQQRDGGLQFEWRVWLKADTGFARDIAARRPFGVSAKVATEWFFDNPYPAPTLCDRTEWRGACPPNQFQSDGKTLIPVGAAVLGTTVKVKVSFNSAVNQRVGLEIELRRLSENGGGFSGSPTHVSGLGPGVRMAELTIPGLISGRYHWRSRTVDSTGRRSAWDSFGGNFDNATDFSVGLACPGSAVSGIEELKRSDCGGKAPLVTTTTATSVTQSSVVLTASVNPSGSSTTGFFEYWGSQSAQANTVSQQIGSDVATHSFSQAVNGLRCGTAYSFRCVAANSAGETRGATLGFSTLPCSSPAALTINAASLPEAVPGQPYSTQLTATGGSGGYTWSLRSGSLPNGLTLSPQSGTISGTPSQASQASQASSFTVGVQDSAGHLAIRSFSIPVRQSMSLDVEFRGVVLTVGAVYSSSNSILYHAYNAQPPFSWRAVGLPPGLEIDPIGGFVAGSPTQAGIFTAEITAFDALGASASIASVLQVTSLGLMITDASGNKPATPPPGTVGRSYQFFFLAQGGKPGTYTWALQGNLPPGLIAQNGPGCPQDCALQISGTPSIGGSSSFTVSVRDALGNSASQNATIVINNSTPPTITSSRFPKATIGVPYSVSLTATGGTPGYVWTLVGNSPDPGLQVSTTGVLSGTPTRPNDCSAGATDGGGGWIGPSFPSTSFTVRVTDGTGQSTTQSLCLVEYFPSPVITGFSPASVVVDGQVHIITVLGRNFRGDSKLMNDTDSETLTSFISDTALSFTLTPSNPGDNCPLRSGIARYCEGARRHRVRQPYTEFGVLLDGFSVEDPLPMITSVSAVANNTFGPCHADTDCQLIVQGSGFNFNSTFQIVETGATLSRFGIPGTLPWTTETVGSFRGPAGSYTVRVTNSFQPGGGTASATGQFTVQP